MLTELIKPVVDYLKGQPFNNVLIAAMLAVIVYVNVRREEQTRESHNMVHNVFKEIREENQRNQDRLVDAMQGVKREVTKIPAATHEAAERIVEAKAAEKSE